MTAAGEVREAYQGSGDGADSKERWLTRGGEFDLWLESVRRAAAAEALRGFADYILHPKYEGLDAYTLGEAALEARVRAVHIERGDQL